ncbi:hypothetical protein ABZ726_01605 [Streptomyces hundungensis]|uniref:DUF6907 domain-containing protein n=1 Tax=Streptomyces hundungensis TaxID=1077946 RepID=UPI0033DEA95A
MDANQWKATVTGEACPPWCKADHADEDPVDGSIIHESGQVEAFRFPPLLRGDQYTLAFETEASENYEDQQRRTMIAIRLIDTDGRDLFPDAVPVRSRAEADSLIAGLEQSAGQLRAWRQRLPEQTPTDR